MATTRSYADRCGIARALDAVGERWALLIVRELVLGPKRFGELREALPRITPAVLTDRLRELEAGGILRHLPTAAGRQAGEYELTERGYELEPVLLALGRWGSSAPVAPDSTMSVDSHVLALRTLFSPQAAAGLAFSLELDVEGELLQAHVADRQLRIGRGRGPAGDVRIALDRATLRGLLWGGRELEEAIAAGAATAVGDLGVARAFFRLFPQA